MYNLCTPYTVHTCTPFTSGGTHCKRSCTHYTSLCIRIHNPRVCIHDAVSAHAYLYDCTVPLKGVEHAPWNISKRDPSHPVGIGTHPGFRGLGESSLACPPKYYKKTLHFRYTHCIIQKSSAHINGTTECTHCTSLQHPRTHIVLGMQNQFEHIVF